MLIANVLAQTEALAFDKTAQQVKGERTPDWLVPHPYAEGLGILRDANVGKQTGAIGAEA